VTAGATWTAYTPHFEQALAEAGAVDSSAPFAGVPCLFKDIGAGRGR
jgi:hypothetical protein